MPAGVCQTRHACDSLAAGSIHIILGKFLLLPFQLDGENRSFYDVLISAWSEPSMTLDVLGVDANGSHLHCCGRDRLKDAMRDQIDDLEGLVLSDFMSKDMIFVPEEN